MSRRRQRRAGVPGDDLWRNWGRRAAAGGGSALCGSAGGGRRRHLSNQRRFRCGRGRGAGGWRLPPPPAAAPLRLCLRPVLGAGAAGLATRGGVSGRGSPRRRPGPVWRPHCQNEGLAASSRDGSRRARPSLHFFPGTFEVTKRCLD